MQTTLRLDGVARFRSKSAVFLPFLDVLLLRKGSLLITLAMDKNNAQIENHLGGQLKKTFLKENTREKGVL